MWKCSKCNRDFKTQNQSHSCVKKDIGEFFIGKPDELVLAFDQIMTQVLTWQPNSFGASINTIVFTNTKAWLIVKAMKTELDLKFYYDEQLESLYIKKVTIFNKKYAHHIRINHESQITDELISLLKKGYEYAHQ